MEWNKEYYRRKAIAAERVLELQTAVERAEELSADIRVYREGLEADVAYLEGKVGQFEKRLDRIAALEGQRPIFAGQPVRTPEDRLPPRHHRYGQHAAADAAAGLPGSGVTTSTGGILHRLLARLRRPATTPEGSWKDPVDLF